MSFGTRRFLFTSPHGGEVDPRSGSCEGVLTLACVTAPHPNPLPNGERERAVFVVSA
jgi:hypothetical protein